MAKAEDGLHSPTLLVVDVMNVVLASGGWLGTSEIAAQAGGSRDTVRRVLKALASRGWVREDTRDNGASAWQAGPELPRLGLSYLHWLQQLQRSLAADFEAATIPHRWASADDGTPHHGRAPWQPGRPIHAGSLTDPADGGPQ